MYSIVFHIIHYTTQLFFHPVTYIVLKILSPRCIFLSWAEIDLQNVEENIAKLLCTHLYTPCYHARVIFHMSTSTSTLPHHYHFLSVW